MSASEFTGIRLLVVDDEPDIALVLRHAFRNQIRNLGWTLDFAQSGEEAIKAVRESPEFDAILTDINMPNMDGLKLLCELEALDSDTKAIVVSAYGDMGNIRRAMQMGAIDFVTKPIDIRELVDSVNKTIAASQRLKWGRLSDKQQSETDAVIEARGRFVTSLSRELRDPLNLIMLYTQTMLGDQVEKELPADSQTILNAARQVTKLVHNLLDFLTLEAGGMVLHAEKFSIADLISEVAAAARSDVETRGNQLDVVGADSVESMRADRNRVRQCLGNLLSNAGKFTENGTVTLAVEQLPGDREFVVFKVSDTGVGMTPEQIKLIFNHFEMDGDYAGHGLGLPIVSLLSDLMGGSIDVDSTPETGSVFILRLPINNEVPTPEAEAALSN